MIDWVFRFLVVVVFVALLAAGKAQHLEPVCVLASVSFAHRWVFGESVVEFEQLPRISQRATWQPLLMGHYTCEPHPYHTSRRLEFFLSH